MNSGKGKFCGAEWLAGVVLLAIAAGPVQAARPSAPRLLPKDTVALVRVVNTQDLKEHFLKTSLGRIAQDPQVQPLVKQLYGSGLEALAAVEQQLGISIDDAWKLFQGEVAVGVVVTEQGTPAVVLLLDVGDKNNVAEKLIERATQMLEQNGGKKQAETIDGTEITTFQMPGRNGPQGAANRSVSMFQREGTVAIATNLDVIKELLAKWTGSKQETLSTNQNYAAVMRQCQALKDQAQVTWYFDPLTLAKGLARANPIITLGINMLPTLGLDGLQGVGGSFLFAEGEFDTVMHVHVLLDNPRAGVIEALALGSGDTTPERWVPGDVQSYSTWFWDFDKTLAKATNLLDSFQGEGSLKKLIKTRISDPLGVDFETDILPLMAGRVSMLRWIPRPATTPQSQSNLVAVKLKDADAFAKTFQTLVEKNAERVQKKSYGGVTYYILSLPQRDLAEDQPTPCACLLDGYLLVANQPALLEKIIVDKEDASKGLANALDYKLIASKVGRQANGSKPGMVTFNRPEEDVRMLYDLATNPKLRDQMGNPANNAFFRKLNEALEKNPLPPFTVFSKYLAPGGGLLINDDTGFHYMSFTLHRE